MEGAIALSTADTGSDESNRRAVSSALHRSFEAFATAMPHISFRSSWINSNANVGVGAWSNQSSPPTTIQGTAACGFVLGAHTLTDQDLLDLRANTSSLVESVAGVGGCLTVVFGDRSGVTVCSSVVPASPVYYGEKDGVTAASTSSAAVLAAIGATPEVDPTAMHGLVQAGYLLGAATPYAGVCFLRSGEHIRMTRHGIEILEHDLFNPSVATGRSDPVEVLAESLVEAVRPLERTGPITLALSGGRDSRLIAAALHAAGINFSAKTRGEPGEPDVRIAKAVANRLGVPHSTTSRSTAMSAQMAEVEHPFRRAFRVAHVTEGTTSAWDDVSALGHWKGSRVLSGIGGEVLRGGYAYSLSEVDRNAAEKKVSNLFGSSLLTSQANDRAEAEAEVWHRRVSDDPHTALDLLYLYERLGRWGVARKAAITRNLFFGPFLDNRVLSVALAIPARTRWSEKPVASLVERLAPSLDGIPLEGRPWRFEQAAGPKANTPSHDWRRLSDPNLRDVVETAVCETSGVSAGRFFDLVDERSLFKARENEALSHGKMWNMLTYRAFLQNEEWVRDKPEVLAVRNTSM